MSEDENHDHVESCPRMKNDEHEHEYVCRMKNIRMRWDCKGYSVLCGRRQNLSGNLKGIGK